MEYLEKLKKSQDAINDLSFKRIYLFTIVNKKDILRIVVLGPLFESKEKLKKHKKYMEEIFKNNNRKGE